MTQADGAAALAQAATGLADALEAENEALRDMDITEAVARFPHKAAWTERLHHALANFPVPIAAGREELAPSVARLESLAQENRRLLERALFVQGRVIATLVRAVPRPPAGYGATAKQYPMREGRMRPVTLSARA